MSKLTTPIKIEIPGIGTIESADLYLKYEADKVIADLEESHKMEVEQLLMEIAELKEKHKTEVKELLCLIRDKENNFNRAFDSEEKEIRHHKYRRCLAMVRWCEAEMWNIRNTPLCDMTTHEVWQHDDEFWQKWNTRWLKIDEQFKEKK